MKKLNCLFFFFFKIFKRVLMSLMMFFYSYDFIPQRIIFYTMEVIRGAFLSTFFKTLFDNLMSIEELFKFAPKKQTHSELKKWELRLLEICVVLNDAEEMQITNLLVKKWLSEL